MYAPSRRLIALATASSSGAGSFAISAAMTSVSELVRSRIPSAASSSRSVVAFVRLPLCPSVTVRAPVLHDRLRVRPVRRARGRVARMADRRVTLQAAQLLLGEDLGDEAHVSQHGETALVGDGDSGRFLPAVLQREQAEVRDARYVTVWSANAEDAAHLDRHLVGLPQFN